MDLNILIFGVLMELILLLIALLGSGDRITRVLLAIIGGVGTLIGGYLTLSLLADGSITEISGGTSSVILSASTAITSPWRFIEIILLGFALISAMSSMRQVWKSL